MSAAEVCIWKPDLEIRLLPYRGLPDLLARLGIPAGAAAWRSTPELAPPHDVAHRAIDHSDGLDTIADLPRSGRCL